MLQPARRRTHALRAAFAKAVHPLLLGLAVVHLASGAASAATGRDGGTGYEWFDSASGATPGPGFFDGPSTAINLMDDAPPVPVTLPFMFPYYGGSTNTIWISDNGWISVVDPMMVPHPTPTALPSPAAPLGAIAPFWSDLTIANPAMSQYVRYGPVNAFNAFRIQYASQDTTTSQLVLLDLYLYTDGRIKFHYLLATNFSVATVGIQNRTGTDGFSVIANGMPAMGVNTSVTAGYAIDILPPATLAGQCGMVTPATCGTPIMESLPGTFPANILTYGCAMGNHAARERVYTLTFTEATRLQAVLTAGTARNLRMYLLDFCSERACLIGPSSNMSTLLPAGTYYLAVDAPLQADEGSFTLQVTCTPLGVPMTCGDTVSGSTIGGTSLFNTYPCAPGRNLSGPETGYYVTVGASTNLRATLTATSADLDILLLQMPTGRAITSADCVLHGDDQVVYWGIPPGDYLLLVDGFNGASGTFTLETECIVAMDCSTTAGTIDFTTGNRQNVMGDTSMGTSAVDVYQCNPAVNYDGNELIYEFTLTQAGQVGVYEPGTISGLTFFILDACNEGSCVSGTSGACGGALGPGTHYLVVDSPAGAEGPFFAQLVFEDTFNRWSECEDPDGATSLTDTVRTVWEFDDHDYCYTDPGSRNYPDGCTFAMYVAVRCGTEFHIPLFDVESGHVRVYDVFRDEYVQLTAVSTGGLMQSGIDIQWEDCAGTDPTVNEETVDIWFERPEGLCGVYRIEFPLHSGFIWDLFANCSGQNVAGFDIYDSLCGALAAYDPLPNISLTNVDAVLNCPDITVTYTLTNTGCAPGENVAVTLFDNSVAVGSEIVPVVEPGLDVTRTFTVTFPGGISSSNVTLSVDAGDAIQECQETPNAGCGIDIGIDELRTQDCGPNCDITAGLVVTPPGICEGGTVTIDASGSAQTGCTSGVLEYRLVGPGGPTAWQTSAVFAGLAPTETTDYTLEVRCSDPPLQAVCVDAVTVTVPVDRRPIFDGASVTVTPQPCGAIELAWAPATFLGPTGQGAYSVYRSTVSCADAVDPTSSTAVRLGAAVAPNFTDGAIMPGATYYYVVEAEDETFFLNGCTPGGPQFGGATSRRDAPGGTCAAIQPDFGAPVDMLPRVGMSLRLGAPDPYDESTVPLRWQTSFPIDVAADEHYHVLRAEDPSDIMNFTRINTEPPLLQTESFVDTAADATAARHVYYYLVFVSNQCEVDNRLLDRFTSMP